MPAGFADYQVAGVKWVATDAQRAIVKALRERESATARELASATDVSKRHVAKTLSRLLDEELVTYREGVGDHGADVFHAEEGPTSGLVDLTPEDITNRPVWNSSTWSFAITDVELPQVTPVRWGDPPSTIRAVSLAAFQEGPPPE